MENNAAEKKIRSVQLMLPLGQRESGLSSSPEKVVSMNDYLSKRSLLCEDDTREKAIERILDRARNILW